MLEIKIKNETLYPIDLPGLTTYLGSGQSLQISSDEWDSAKDNPKIERLLLSHQISVSTGHLSSLEGLDISETEQVIKDCKDTQVLRKWFLLSKKDKSDIGKFTRYLIYQKISTLGYFQWQKGDQDGLDDEAYWTPRMIGKKDRDADHREALNRNWERQFRIKEIKQQAKQYEQELLKKEGLI